MQITSYLNIAARTQATKALGPGSRYAIWVQGCPFNCRECIAPDWIPIRKADIYDIEELVQEVVSLPIDGITISGGEPMLQAGELSVFLKLIYSTRPGLTTIVFTGFKIEQLIWQEAKDLLAQTDLLIDGLYQRNLHTTSGLRGSENQRLHFLSDKLLPYRQSLESEHQIVELQIQDNGILQVGIPDRNFNWVKQ